MLYWPQPRKGPTLNPWPCVPSPFERCKVDRSLESRSNGIEVCNVHMCAQVGRTVEGRSRDTQYAREGGRDSRQMGMGAESSGRDPRRAKTAKTRVTFLDSGSRHARRPRDELVLGSKRNSGVGAWNREGGGLVGEGRGVGGFGASQGAPKWWREIRNRRNLTRKAEDSAAEVLQERDPGPHSASSRMSGVCECVEGRCG